MKKALAKFGKWCFDNIVTVMFIVIIAIGFLVAKGITVNFFISELSERLFRNLFIVIALIIPVVAGLGLNFGIVVGAMAAQIAIVINRFLGVGGIAGLLLCFALTLPMAMLFGYFTGLLYNKTKGQEMIASLIVGYFADGLYSFLFLFAVGVIIPVPAVHPLIKPDGIGIRQSVDLLTIQNGGIKYALESFGTIPFMVALIILAVVFLGLIGLKRLRQSKLGMAPGKKSILIINIMLCVGTMIFSSYNIITNSTLMQVRPVPIATCVVVAAICIFTDQILKTKLGQDFKSVGQDQHISEISGIAVNKKRIIAVIISTVLAGWGQLIFLQNMGTMSTYNAHKQIGMFSVASLLVGGASTSQAKISHAFVGTILFNSMFILSPEIGQAVFGSAILGEYFRSFMAYGVIGVALSLYIWKAKKPKSSFNFTKKESENNVLPFGDHL